MVTYQFTAGDYIEFTRIVQPARDCYFRTDFATGRAIAMPAVPEQILQQRGEGQIQRVIDEPRKVGGEKLQTARVYAGSTLGTVTAVLDDAILVGKQPSLFEVAASDTGESTPMYGTDARGGA